MGWRTDGYIYEQKILLIRPGQEYEIGSMNCCALVFDAGTGTKKFLQYPQVLIRDNCWFKLSHYSWEKDTVFYKYNGEVT